MVISKYDRRPARYRGPLARLLVGVLAGVGVCCTASAQQASASAAAQTRAANASPVITSRNYDAGNQIGAFVGFTDRHDAEFSYGLQGEHALSDNWSAGVILEHTPDAYARSSATLAYGTVNYRLPANPRLKFTGGAGVEFKDYYGDDVMFRAGASYDLFVEGKWLLTPTLAVNFGDGEQSMTVGASLQYRL